MKITKTLLTCDRYFPNDKEARNIYRVTITNRGQRASFKFGDSIANTQEHKPLDDYSILACVKSDYYYTKKRFPILEDFVDEFGYDLSRKKAEKIYKQCLKQAEKLHRVFTQEEIEKLSD